MRGYSAPRLIIKDEAAFVSDAMQAALDPMLAVSNGRLIELSSPNGRRGHFYENWEHGEGVERIRIIGRECPRISAEFLEKQCTRIETMFIPARSSKGRSSTAIRARSRIRDRSRWRWLTIFGTGFSGLMQNLRQLLNSGGPVFQVRHLERMPLGVSYTGVVDHVARLLAPDWIALRTGGRRDRRRPADFRHVLLRGDHPDRHHDHQRQRRGEAGTGTNLCAETDLDQSRLQALLHQGRLKIHREIPDAGQCWSARASRFQGRDHRRQQGDVRRWQNRQAR